MHDPLFVELAGPIDAPALKRAFRALARHLGGGEPVFETTTDRMDPREAEFEVHAFRLESPRGRAHLNEAAFQRHFTIWLELSDLDDFAPSRRLLVDTYGGRDTTDRPEVAAYNARRFLEEGRPVDALAIAQRVLATELQAHEGRARSVLEGIRLAVGGEGPDGAWLESTLARDPGNLAAWKAKGGPAAQRVLRLLTPYDLEALAAGEQLDPEASGTWHRVERDGRPATWDAQNSLWNVLLGEAGVTVWDTLNHAARGRDGLPETVNGLVVARPREVGEYVIQHKAFWYGNGLRAQIQVTTRSRRWRHVHWLADEELDRLAVIVYEASIPRKGGSTKPSEARIQLLPRPAAWAKTLKEAGLSLV